MPVVGTQKEKSWEAITVLQLIQQHLLMLLVWLGHNWKSNPYIENIGRARNGNKSPNQFGRTEPFFGLVNPLGLVYLEIHNELYTRNKACPSWSTSPCSTNLDNRRKIVGVVVEHTTFIRCAAYPTSFLNKKGEMPQ